MSIRFLFWVIVIGLLLFWGAMAALLVILHRRGKSQAVRLERHEVRKTLGEKLKQYRTSCGMTQEFVAETLGVSRQAVSKWETGKSDPSTSNLLALAKLYGISAEQLLKEVER